MTGSKQHKLGEVENRDSEIGDNHLGGAFNISLPLVFIDNYSHLFSDLLTFLLLHFHTLSLFRFYYYYYYFAAIDFGSGASHFLLFISL